MDDKDDVKKFTDNAAEYWVEIRRANPKGANSCNRRNDSIVKRRARVGDVVDFLSFFLDSPLPDVRFAAAAFLLNYDASPQAIDVLRKLKSAQDVGAMSVSAGMILDAHKIEKY
ncbi:MULTISPECIES: hypothetical protein [Massilia]|uniref:hypothetical protein n=1 Tax=Massilia TaxID=149698 RepID=UPI002796B12D|nr:MULTISPECIES: hypothetical protein [unclassified Massilia]MDQ1835262.1 hypothetical protein [Massilia sp. CCM 9029]MDQ1925102.1 hypothetical protein [Massilia sp. CCM 9206]